MHEQLPKLALEAPRFEQPEQRTFLQNTVHRSYRILALGASIAAMGGVVAPETLADDTTIPPQVAFGSALQTKTNYAVRAKRLEFLVDAYGTAEDYSVISLGNTTNMRLMTRFSTPQWRRVAGMPKWEVGQLSEDVNSHVRFSFMINRHAKVGKNACAWIRQEADPSQATLEQNPTMKPKIIDTKVCVKVYKQTPK